MITVKCTRCSSFASGCDVKDARSKIDHAPGLSRGIKCGDNFNQVFETISETKPTVKTDTLKKVEEKPVKKIKTTESKTSTFSK